MLYILSVDEMPKEASFDLDINLLNKSANQQIKIMRSIYMYSKQLIDLLVPSDSMVMESDTPDSDPLFDEFGKIIYKNRLDDDILHDVEKSSHELLSTGNKLYNEHCNLVFKTNVIDAFKDVNGIDELMWARCTATYNYSFYIIVLCDDLGKYLGHMWAYLNTNRFPDLIGIYAIQTTPCNVTKGISYKLLQGLKDISSDTLVVPWPLPAMHHILTKMGFTEHNVPYNTRTRERQFLEPRASTTNYFIGDLTLIP